MDINQIDVRDDAAVAAWHQVHAAAAAHDRAEFPAPTLERDTGRLRNPWPGEANEFWLAVDGGEPVGSLQIHMPTLDNLDNIGVDFTVPPAHRRRGIGRALYGKAVERARFHHRKNLQTDATQALPGTEADSPHGPGMAFAAKMGFRRVLDEAHRRWVSGVVSEEELARQLAEAWTHAEGYELVTWRDRVPERYAADLAYLDSRVMMESPIGDLAFEEEKIDADRVRAGEEVAHARGHLHFAVGLVHRESDTLAAYSALASDQGDEWHAWQHNTIASSAHRGHRLGTIVKLENLAFYRATYPQLRAIDTSNAADNAYMIVINERMGFRWADTWVNWQQEL
ncbi:GNAT family N-acetyltransferase [Longispora fulva]|uniref:GNAT superfamily N-acetyltransferase n=1 Tax=Longispora fulva TaxID=619741 RepID=A0A8J7GJ92_9ACTN|nr:GNAT family N-acetyltransferase [Longispora fulva]MBG6139136.1 GNAT superfamily N-acetyltransferase [Longispora fulva]GIG58628.1 GNAT family N-acetyltransferase [Longispora fulva]